MACGLQVKARMNYTFYCIGPDDVPRLRDEHSFLSRQLAEVIALAAADRPKDCDVSWELFARELQRHMQYEENLLFPAFAKRGTAEQRGIELFRAAHEELRNPCQQSNPRHSIRPYGATKRDLFEVIGLMQNGKLKADLERHPLAEAPGVLTSLMQGRVRGRAVLIP